MVKENISQKFRLKIIDETRNYFLEEIEQKEPMSQQHKNVYPSQHKRLEDVRLWSYFGRDVPDHYWTKIGRIRF